MRRAQRAGAGQDADQLPSAVDDRREPAAAGVEQRRTPRCGSTGSGSVSGSGDITWCSWANRSAPGAVGLGHDADRAAVVDDDDRAVRALGQQGERVADRAVRRSVSGGVDDQVPLLDPGDDLAHDVDRDVLRQHRERRRGGRPSRPSGGRRPRSCWRRRAGWSRRCRRSWQVDVEAGGDLGAGRDHEDVVVGQVVRRRGLEEAHEASDPVCWPLG